jgi:N-formylglutamate amidohydrolase
LDDLLIHVPHASVFIPSAVRGQFLLDDAALMREAAASADLHTDALATAAWPRASIVTARVSRIVIDVERFEDDRAEEMARVGRGMIYTHTHAGWRMRRALSADERAELHKTYYTPHWHGLRQAARGRTLIDLHSYPREPWPVERDPAAGRPEIDLGTSERVTPRQWVRAARAHFQDLGFCVGRNTPYAGVIDAGADAAMMIEIRRDMLAEPGSAPWNRMLQALRTMPIWPAVQPRRRQGAGIGRR